MLILFTQTPKHLESLTINGATKTMQLLHFLAKGSEQLCKVTLSRTLLTQDHLKILYALPKLHCLRLRSNAYNGSHLTFIKEEFPQLEYFLVEGTQTTETDIKFEDGATAELEKIVLSFTNIRSLHGIDSLPQLKELELEANQFLVSLSQDEAAPEQHTESTQSRAPKQDTESGANTQGRDPVQNTQRQHPEQKMEGTAAKQSTQSRAHEKNTESRAVDKNTQGRAPEKSPESKARQQGPQNIVPARNTESRFTFKKQKFQHLVHFRVKDSKMTTIVFQRGAAPELKKMALSLDDPRSNLTGIGSLPKLKEVELKGDRFLLSFFEEAHQITKMTLRDTQLRQADLQILAKKPNLCCLVLSDRSYAESQLTFNEDEFPRLDLLIVECHRIIKIINFGQESAPKLEKIVWSFSKMESLSGISSLLKLKEVECRGELVTHHVRRDIAAHQNRPVLTHKKPQQPGEAEETSMLDDEDEDDDKGSINPPFCRRSRIRAC